MTSLILNSASDRIYRAPLLRPSVKQSRGKKRLCTRFRSKQDRVELLQQLDACYEELNVAIMAETEERERINREHREKVHQLLDDARETIDKLQEAEATKLNVTYKKFADMVADRNRRLKTDTLRKLTEFIQTLISNAKRKLEESSPVVSTTDCPPKTAPATQPQAAALPVPVAKPVDPPAAKPVDPPVAESAQSPEKAPAPAVVPTVVDKPIIEPPKQVTPEKVSSIPQVVTPPPKVIPNDPQPEQPKVVKEVISEAAKMRQQPQIPWRRPSRLEAVMVPEVKKKAPEEKKKAPEVPFVEPLKTAKEPERLALKYKTKPKKRPAEDPLPMEPSFKKPFPVGAAVKDHNHQPQKPLFQRRHQLPPPSNPTFNRKDPRTYGEYCQRRMMQMQMQSRFENQNQQYFRPRPNMPPQQQQQQQQQPPQIQRPAAAAHPFVMPAPVGPMNQTNRPPAPRASVQPMLARPPAPVAPVPAANEAPAKPQDHHKKQDHKINPVYSKDEPIALGKKEPIKKGQPTKPAEADKAEVDSAAAPKDDAKPAEENKTEETARQDKEKKPDESKTVDTDRREKEIERRRMMALLKEIGDDEKVKQILDVMNKKSDDESEAAKTDKQNKESATAKAKPGPKKTKKYKRIQSKLDDSSSEEETAKKEEEPKPVEKPKAKRVSGGSREVSMLIENVTDWMSKGREMHYTRRRVTTGNGVQSGTVSSSPEKQAQATSSTEGERTGGESGGEDEPQLVAKKLTVEEDSLLTVTKSPPKPKENRRTRAASKQTKESSFVYNDKKSVHCNSNYSSNCALCSFNGSALVDHYVYEHKQYEVFVSRVSPKMADIIRADLFLTNGTVINEGGDDEKIKFKCYFCLVWKELSRVEWTRHLASHTGEYRYRCTSCPVMSQTEELDSSFYHEKTCLKPSLAIYNNIEFNDNHLYGFMCDSCNYIQVRRVNMERHLKREHPSVDVSCTRFSIVNFKVDAKPIIDEDQVMLDMSDSTTTTSNMPTVLIPLQPKAEPTDAYEIVNQPITEDDDMPEAEAVSTFAHSSRRRTDIRLESVHMGPAGEFNDFLHRPFSFKLEQELQGAQISSSGSGGAADRLYEESPMSPEPAGTAASELDTTAMMSGTSEAEAIVPVIQIQSVQGGFDLAKVLFKREKDDTAYDSDASDKTTDFNMSDAENSSEGQQQKGDGSGSSGDNTGSNPSGSGGSSAGGGGGESSSSSAGSAGAGGAAGGSSGGDGDGNDNRKNEEFPVPMKIKEEKDDEEEKKKKASAEESQPVVPTPLMVGDVVIKTEKPDKATVSVAPPPAETQYDFVELVLDSTRIEHVAYVEYQGETLYLCLMPGCQHISKSQPDFIAHVTKKHNQVLWDGYCHPCQSQIAIDNCTIQNELQHLIDIHARRKTPTLEMSDVRSVPPPTTTLRIRKIPGDTLSRGESQPPPLAPILPQTAVPISIFAGPSTMQPGGPTPIFIQSAATITSIPMQNNTIITPTHTIPAQIRPVIASTVSTAGVPNSSPPALAPVSINSAIPSMANLKLNTVRLKPWTNMVTTKNQEHCRSMLDETSLLCLYKCMSRSCAFTTNNRFFMEQHLQLHEQLHDSRNNSRKCWLECAYCDIIAPNNNVLLAHIDAEHASCGFQCNLCFYRSRDPTNVVVHQKTYHPTGNIPKKIMIMPDHLKSFGDDEWRSMQESLRKNVLPLHCTSEYDLNWFNSGGGRS